MSKKPVERILHCHYCGRPTQLVGGAVIYPHRPDLAAKKYWRCEPCGAYVGCHPGGNKPLGIVAKPELRRLKSQVHALLDPIWREGKKRRTSAYWWLAHGMGIQRSECHVGMFTEERCRQALGFLSAHHGACPTCSGRPFDRDTNTYCPTCCGVGLDPGLPWGVRTASASSTEVKP